MVVEEGQINKLAEPVEQGMELPREKRKRKEKPAA
jgi:hypothetical protein